MEVNCIILIYSTFNYEMWFENDCISEFATLEYTRANDTITFTHTEVPEVFRGKGVGKLLAEVSSISS